MKKIVVCIRQGLDGEINPFDASAYECALKMPDAEVTLLSMGPEKTRDFLLSLTRLGAKNAVLLSDKAFAGADTLATAYALSLAVKRLSPDLVICGRQTLVGDTGQTGPMLAELAGYALVTEVMTAEPRETGLTASTRDGETVTVDYPTLITVERSFTLRFPRLGSKMKTVEIWSAADIGADPTRIGLTGSPTRVMQTFENASGRRKCRFIEPTELMDTIDEGLKKGKEKVAAASSAQTETLSSILIVGEAPRSYAESVCDNIHTVEPIDAETVLAAIDSIRPAAVLFGSDSHAKRLAATVAARRSLGLCADCTMLEASGNELIMYRPALSGSLIAKIRSRTRPALATVRTEDASASEIIVCAGYGVRDQLDEVKAFADRIGAGFAVTRKLVDQGYAPYPLQVGLTGRTVSPTVYVAVGVSGAVHHIVGMERAGTVIAVNPDKDAAIFEYADYGVISNLVESQ